MSGTLVGLVLVAAVSICGADGLWVEFDLPPVLVAALGAILVQWLKKRGTSYGYWMVQ